MAPRKRLNIPYYGLINAGAAFIKNISEFKCIEIDKYHGDQAETFICVGGTSNWTTLTRENIARFARDLLTYAIMTAAVLGYMELWWLYPYYLVPESISRREDLSSVAFDYYRIIVLFWVIVCQKRKGVRPTALVQIYRRKVNRLRQRSLRCEFWVLYPWSAQSGDNEHNPGFVNGKVYINNRLASMHSNFICLILVQRPRLPKWKGTLTTSNGTRDVATVAAHLRHVLSYESPCRIWHDKTIDYLRWCLCSCVRISPLPDDCTRSLSDPAPVLIHCDLPA